MSMITDNIKQAIAGSQQVIGTVSKEGIPNLAAIINLTAWDDHTLVVTHHFWSKTRKNIDENPERVSILMFNPTTFESYQFKGKVTLETSGVIFEEMCRKSKAFEAAHGWQDVLKPQAVAIMDVQSIYDSTPGPEAGELIGKA